MVFDVFSTQDVFDLMYQDFENLKTQVEKYQNTNQTK